MLPVVNSSNSLERFKGNSLLVPEYRHELNVHGLLFDEFSFTSLFVNLRGTYTKDKVNWARTINSDLSQDVTLVNVKNDYKLEGMVEFSKPIRKLGITMDVSLGEKYTRGYNLDNDTSNKTNVFNHNLSLKLSNRKKTKWDISAGGSIDLTDTKYSFRHDLNNYFYSIGYFAELSFTPNIRWHFSCNADVNQYFAKSFTNTVTIPLLKAEVSYSCLKHNKGSVILEAFDLLNSNTGLERISELNYLMEKRSSIIGRYFMLSFKYRLSRAGEKAAGNTITIGK
jgi:hypothetical protein